MSTILSNTENMDSVIPIEEGLNEATLVMKLSSSLEYLNECLKDVQKIDFDKHKDFIDELVNIHENLLKFIDRENSANTIKDTMVNILFEILAINEKLLPQQRGLFDSHKEKLKKLFDYYWTYVKEMENKKEKEDDYLSYLTSLYLNSLTLNEEISNVKRFESSLKKTVHYVTIKLLRNMKKAQKCLCFENILLIQFMYKTKDKKRWFEMMFETINVLLSDCNITDEEKKEVCFKYGDSILIQINDINNKARIKIFHIEINKHLNTQFVTDEERRVIITETLKLFDATVFKRLLNDILCSKFDNKFTDIEKNIFKGFYREATQFGELEALIELHKGILLCLDKDFKLAKQRLEVSLSAQKDDRTEKLLEKIEPLIKSKSNEIDESYIPANLREKEIRSSSPNSFQNNAINRKKKVKSKRDQRENSQLRSQINVIDEVTAKNTKKDALNTQRLNNLAKTFEKKDNVQESSKMLKPNVPDKALKTWTVYAYCSRCNELLKNRVCSTHKSLNKNTDLVFKAYFNDKQNELKPIRKYPNKFEKFYSKCKVKKCLDTNCGYSHNDLENYIWNYMLKHKLKNLYQLAEGFDSDENNEAIVEPKNMIKNGIVSNQQSHQNQHVELPQHKYEFKEWYGNLYCRICHESFDNKATQQAHKQKKSHSNIQKLIRQFQFKNRVPPNPTKLTKEELIICPQMGTKNPTCNYAKKEKNENFCKYPHNSEELDEWAKWFDYYKENKSKTQLDKNPSLSDYLMTQDLPKLKSIISYYSNDNYQKQWYDLLTELDEFNYDALMHNMISNEMKSCIETVEGTNWTCINIEGYDQERNTLNLNLISNVSNPNELRFYKDQRFNGYIKLLDIKIDRNQTSFVLPIIEKVFVERNNCEFNLKVSIDNTNYLNLMNVFNQPHLKNEIKCTLKIDRSMFYLMHYAIDCTRKSIIFPPRIDLCKLDIVESDDLYEGEIKLNSCLTDKQKNIIERILKAKTDKITPPTVVFGGFGTGKSSCIAEATRCLALRENSKILLSTFNESAVKVYFSNWDKETKRKVIRLVQNECEIDQTKDYETICCVPLTKDTKKKFQKQK